MLATESRIQLIKQLITLQAKLAKKPLGLIRDLPDEIQKEIRQFSIIGPFTAGGLERVTGIIERINWAVYYLNDPNFPQSYHKRKSLAAKQQAAVNQSVAKGSAESQSTVTEQSDIQSQAASLPQSPVPQSPVSPQTLDFGPYNPGK